MVDSGFAALNELPVEAVTETYSRRGLIGEKQMLSWAKMKAGVHAEAHSHPHEQAFWILSGKMDFRLDKERRTCVAGDLILVPPNVEHESWCLEDTEFLTVLSPPREDLMPGATAPGHLKG